MPHQTVAEQFDPSSPQFTAVGVAAPRDDRFALLAPMVEFLSLVMRS